MIRPDPRELQELVRELHRQGTAWLPSGLATRLDWGPPVPPECQVLSTARLNRVVEHCDGDFTISVEAGLPVQELQELLARQRQWLALDWPWGGGAAAAGSVGGLVARGMAGGYRQRYYGVRDQVIGLKLMRADGVWAQAGGRVVKNVAGYDLMRLFTGSWGSLGLITAVTLRTQPRPRQRRRLRAEGPPASLAVLRQRLLLESPLSLELLDWQQPAAGAPQLLIGLVSLDAMALASQEEVLRQLLPADLTLTPMDPAADPGDAAGPVPAGRWLLRPAVPPVQAPDLLGDPAARPWTLQLGAASGLGLAEAPVTAADEVAVAALRDACQRRGGLLTILQAPPGCHLPAWHDAASRPLIEAVKRQFDPLGQLSPGRLPGVQPASGATV